MPVFKWSKTAVNNATADSTINWAEGMAPSAVNDSSRAEMAAVAKWRDDISGTLTTGGTSTAYTLTTNSAFDSLANMSGAMITFIPHATSGASPTLNVDGLGAKQIRSATGVNVATGALIAGTPYQVAYLNASSEFVLIGYTETFANVTATGALAVTGGSTFTGAVMLNGGFSIASTDAGAAALPNLDIFRDSASPAAGDFIGSVDFNGRDSGAAKQLYARIVSQITDPTAASEDAILILQAVVAGVLTDMLKSSAAGITIPGTLGVAGDVAISTNKFNVTASSGDTAVAGTLGVTGAVTANNAAGITARNTLKAFGSWTMSGTTVVFTAGDAFNIASVIRTSLGDYTITFSSAMPDTTYVAQVTAYSGVVLGNLSKSAGSFNFQTWVPEAIGTKREVGACHFAVYD